MKKILKIVLGFLIIIVCLLTLGCYLLGNKMPESKTDVNAILLTNKMMKATNVNAWNKIRMIQWTFAGRNNYLWDKEQGLVIVEWKKNKVLLNSTNKNFVAYSDNKMLSDKKANDLFDKAWKNFCNDSWWLNPVAKAKDQGVVQSLTDSKNELLVEYKSGGFTPGDAYLYKLDANGLPKSYLMWTQILPIKGLEASFEDWIGMENGAKIATSHKIKGLNFNIKIDNVKTGSGYKDFGYDENPFLILQNKGQKKIEPNTTLKNG